MNYLIEKFYLLNLNEKIETLDVDESKPAAPFGIIRNIMHKDLVDRNLQSNSSVFIIYANHPLNFVV